MKRSTMISIRFDWEDLDDLEKNTKEKNPDGRYENMSQCIRELAKIGHQVVQYQDLMKDPAKAQEFTQKMSDMMKSEQVFEWASTLSTSQMESIIMALKMEKEKRYEQRELI